MQARPHLLFITLTAVVARLVSGFITYAAVLGIAATLDYQRRLLDRELRAAKLEGDLAQAQVQAIKMQVQPHFLFNTLHAINVLIQQDPAVAKKAYDTVASRVGMGRWGKVEEIAYPCIFLASDASSFMTGETIIVDGGPPAQLGDG